MSLQIDGYTPPDKEIALEQGVTFDYELKFGSITIRSKMAGRENVQFRLAMQAFDQWMQRRKNLNKGGIDNEADERLAQLAYDKLVISWETTITSGNKPIAPTRESFVALMTSDACRHVLPVYLQDAGDEEAFRPLDADEAGNASPAPSVGTSDGPARKNGSEK